MTLYDSKGVFVNSMFDMANRCFVDIVSLLTLQNFHNELI